MAAVSPRRSLAIAAFVVAASTRPLCSFNTRTSAPASVTSVSAIGTTSSGLRPAGLMSGAAYTNEARFVNGPKSAAALFGPFTKRASFVYAAPLINPAGRKPEDVVPIADTLVTLAGALVRVLKEHSGRVLAATTNAAIAKDLRGETAAMPDESAAAEDGATAVSSKGASRGGAGAGGSRGGRGAAAAGSRGKGGAGAARAAGGAGGGGSAYKTSSSGSSAFRTAPLPIHRALVQLLLHPVPMVRDATARQVTASLSSVEGLSAALLHALAEHLRDVALGRTGLAGGASGAGSGSATPSLKSVKGDLCSLHDAEGVDGRVSPRFTYRAVPHPSVTAQALAALLPGAESTVAPAAVATLIPQALLVAHSFAAGSNVERVALWGRVVRRLAAAVTGGVAAISGAFLAEETAEALVAHLKGQEGIWSDIDVFREGACRAVASLINGVGAAATIKDADRAAIAIDGMRSFAATQVLPLLTASLDSDGAEVAALSPLELVILATPAGTLCEPPPEEGVYVAKAVESKNVGGRDEAAWAAKVRAEINAKKSTKGAGARGGGKAAPKVDDSDAKKIAEQDDTRKRVTVLRNRLVATLAAVRAFSGAKKRAVRPLLPTIVRHLQPVFSARAVATHVFDVMLVVASAAAWPIPSVAHTLTRALEIVQVEAKKLHSFAAVFRRLFQELAPEIVASLSDSGVTTHLPATSMHVLFPALRAALTSKTTMPQAVLEPALQILAAHATLPAPMVGEEAPEGGPLVNLEDVAAEAASALSSVGAVFSTAATAGSDASVRLGLVGDVATASTVTAHAVALAETTAHLALRSGIVQVLLKLSAVAPRASPSPAAVLSAVCRDANACDVPIAPFEALPLLGDAGLLSAEAAVRATCLHALSTLLLGNNAAAAAGADAGGAGGSPVTEGGARLLEDSLLTSRLWVAVHDGDDDNSAAADALWTRCGASIGTDYMALLLPLLSHKEPNTRKSAGRAIASALSRFPDTETETLTALFEKFTRNAEGLALTVDGTWRPRVGVMNSLEAACRRHALTVDGGCELLRFLIARGLSDDNDGVRIAALDAGVALSDEYGADHTHDLLPILEEFIAEGPRSELAGPNTTAQDHQHEGAVVLLGSLASHLDPSDPKVPATVDTLFAALKTPSEAVQKAVAGCLPRLMKAVKDRAGEFLATLLDRLQNGEGYGDRRGAAYGLAGAVKGLGLGSLKAHNVVDVLEVAASNRSNPGARQGALFAFECLCGSLGLLFEPYVIRILPLLIKAYGDSVREVREAAPPAAQVIMSKLSGHGVKLVMPVLLKGLQEIQWRSKQASIVLLGKMAYCAPRQLSSCLPQIVPKLCEAFGDTHPRVQQAGREALQDVGSVIRNPEILELVPMLLGALSDPADRTGEALDSLTDTAFVHSIDPPSLALIVPILRRGLAARKSAIKSKAAMIVGNMSSLIQDEKDILPYLNQLVPQLKKTLLDPIPDVRSVASRALGTLASGIGEEHFGDLVAWLVDTLQADTSTVERSGGAQGLSEVIVALGEPRLSEVLTELLPLATHPAASSREGLLWVLAFLPRSMGEAFGPYIGTVLPLIVQGLADDSDMVRDVAMRAGQVIVNVHALTATEALLPALNEGMHSDNWRIRQSSVQLLGDMLFRLAGNVKAVGMTGDDGDDAGHGSSGTMRAITARLGRERRDSVLSSIYIMRSDNSAVVRQCALQVWKTIVENTPRTLRDLLATLVEQLIASLASGNIDKRGVAGRCLGDIVRKLGERVLPEIIPILRDNLRSDDEGTRQGVCFGLSEVIGAGSKKQLDEYMEVIIPAVQLALCDTSEDVREAAAVAFSTLQKTVGPRAVDDIIPALLAALDTDDRDESANALHGLRQILHHRAREIMGYLVPKLTTLPISDFHARAIGAVAEATGPTLHHYINRLLPPLFEHLVQNGGAAAAAGAGGDGADGDGEEKVVDMDAVMGTPVGVASVAVVLAVQDQGVQWLTTELKKLCSHEDAGNRRIACFLLGRFAAEATVDYSEQVPMILKELVYRLADPDATARGQGWAALKALVAAITPAALMPHLNFARQCLNNVVSDSRHRRDAVFVDGSFVLPGLCVPGGLDCLLPLFSTAVLNGSADQREVAGNAIGDMLTVTSAKFLASYSKKLPGPLIRAANEKFPGHVKDALLRTLTIAIDKGIVAKHFIPQLQSTFVKGLSDVTSAVRDRAATALGKLLAMKVAVRVDPVVNDLCNGAERNTGGVREAMLAALQGVLRNAGAKVTAPVRASVAERLLAMLDDADSALRRLAAGGVGAAVASMDEESAHAFVATHLLPESEAVAAEWQLRHGRALALNAILKQSAGVLAPSLPRVIVQVRECMVDDKVPVRQAACAAIGLLLAFAEAGAATGGAAGGAGGDAGAAIASELLPAMPELLKDSSASVRRACARGIKRFAKLAPEAVRTHLGALVPPLLAAVKDTNISVKLAAERALLHVLQVHSHPETVAAYAKSADAETAAFVQGYATRVLKKLAPESDEDSDDEDE
uniref:TOG domain-containing protein n=1 Tax=Bicosoecida sp. CB-2014 TaxID=1486930 RepID=A0A7S1C9J2_9STRA|mmetsp:Transcript_16452/g.57519  ORF Transcript_16452/g.57519 Transcript_16452/m.57519 type:complete len:2509 (-) Transcript_16452:12-7538(-)